MHRFRKFALLLMLALGAGTAGAGTIEGRVIEVPDGASLTLLASTGASIHRIRLTGIVAPSPATVPGGIAPISRLAQSRNNLLTLHN